MSAITDLNTSSCLRSSERINCSVRVWMRAREIPRTILRSLCTSLQTSSTLSRSEVATNE